jgi:hypothetical protein
MEAQVLADPLSGPALAVQSDGFVQHWTSEPVSGSDRYAPLVEQVGDRSLAKPIALPEPLSWNTVPVLLDELLDGRFIEPISHSEAPLGSVSPALLSSLPWLGDDVSYRFKRFGQV